MGVKTATGPVPEGSRRGAPPGGDAPGPHRTERPCAAAPVVRCWTYEAIATQPGPHVPAQGGLGEEGSWPMRLAERHPEAAETHYTEGELDLEPPEELAIGELDDEAILEEELDNEDLLEQDVEEDTLEASLEDLVHGGDDEDEDDAPLHTAPGPFATTPESPWNGLGDVAGHGVGGRDVATDDADDDIGDTDVEASLDLVLLDRMALLDDGRAEAEAELEDGVVVSLLLQVLTDGVELAEVAPCGADEFVCRSCFLVRRRVQ